MTGLPPRRPRRAASSLARLAAVSLAALGGALLAAPAAAWLDGGHIVVAKIAHDRLEPETRAEADRLVGLLADFAPVRADFVSASTWLDDIKRAGWRAFDRWHYLNLPWNAEGLPTLPPAATDHVVLAIEDAMATLRDPRAGDLAKAFSLRVLIHVVGDVHQPLHCVNRITLRYPHGDRGGNDFLLDRGNLHLYWDAAAGLLAELDAQSSSAEVEATVAELLSSVPEESLPDWRRADPAAWAREGHRLATTVAYVGVREGREPSEGYRIRVQLVSQRRLVVAGYRLAQLLEQALGPAEAAGDDRAPAEPSIESPPPSP